MSSFDGRANSYQADVERSVAFAHVDHSDITRRKVEHLLTLCTALVGPPCEQRFLDVGCGIGLTDTHLVGNVGDLHGIDISAASVDAARAANPSVRYTAFDGTTFPVCDTSIDLAFAICVLHHVRPDARTAFAAEMRRVLRPGGLVVIFEHNAYNPITRVAVSRCELDRHAVLARKGAVARLLARNGFRVARSAYIIFTPSERWSARADRLLGWLPAGAQYYVAARRPA